MNKGALGSGHAGRSGASDVAGWCGTAAEVTLSFGRCLLCGRCVVFIIGVSAVTCVSDVSCYLKMLSAVALHLTAPTGAGKSRQHLEVTRGCRQV